MALFKVLRGTSTALANQPFHDGYAYFTPDDGRFYIDVQLDTAPPYYFAAGTEGGKNVYRIEIESKTWAELITTKSDVGHHHTMSDLNDAGPNGPRFGTCTTAAATAAKVATITDANSSNFELKTGSFVLIKMTYANGVADPTLNVNNTGAKSIKRYGTTAPSTSANTSWIAGSVRGFVYDGTYWQMLDFALTGNDNTIPAAYCSTGASTAAKTASHSGYSLKPNSYTHITITNSNTAQSALTLNINSKGAKPIYINGAASSATNYTLPAGTYLVYYDGTNYHFRTDDKAPLNISGDAATVGGFTLGTSVPANAVFTDKKVEQKAAITENGAYPIILGESTATTATTSYVNKSSNLTYNPSTKALSTGGTVNGYTLAGASAKSVDSSISSQTSTNLPTTKAVVDWVNEQGYTANVGTVTSVAVQDNGGLTVTGSPITSSGTIKVGHTNSITAQTTKQLYSVKIDKYGHISEATAANAQAIIDALGYTPYNSTNPDGYTSTLGTVTSVTASGALASSGGSTPAITHNKPSTSPAKTTQAVYPIKIDEYGHITAAGSAVTIPTLTSATIISALGYTPYDDANPDGYTANLGTVTSVATGDGLTGGTITTSGTLKANLRSFTKLTNDSAAATETSGRVYPIVLDKSGYLAVNVPWTNVNSNYTNTSVKGDAETNYRTGQVNLTPANLGISATTTSVTVGSTTFNKYTHPTTSGNKHIPSGGSSGQFLAWDSDGTAKWVNNPNTNTDTKVTQTETATDNWRKILVGYQSSATSGAAVSNQTEQAYVSSKLEFQSNSGTLRSTKYMVNDAVTLEYNTTTKSLDFIFA